MKWGKENATDSEIFDALEEAQALDLSRKKKACLITTLHRAAVIFQADKDSALRLPGLCKTAGNPYP